MITCFAHRQIHGVFGLPVGVAHTPSGLVWSGLVWYWYEPCQALLF